MRRLSPKSERIQADLQCWNLFPRPGSVIGTALAPNSSVRSGPRYLFYSLERAEPADRALPSRYSWAVWRPSRWPVLPPALPDSRVRFRFLFRWMLHRLHVFAGDDCGALLIRDGTRLVHYSGFTPRFWRFPFLAEGDLQIGHTWTDRAYRGEGIALFALQTVVSMESKPGRRFWYVVEDVNLASIRVAEKAGFALAGEGTWIKPWGLQMPGSFVMLTSRRGSPRDDAATAKQDYGSHQHERAES